MSNDILLIRTGGTIDAAPYPDAKNPPKHITPLDGDKSLLADTVNRLPHQAGVTIHPWGAAEEKRFVKDSQLFTDEDMDALANLIRNAPQQHFVITHGTDGMVENATRLQARLGATDKTIAFCGAMVPLSMAQSEGPATLQFALENASKQEGGVMVLGREAHTKRLAFFAPDDVEKDREASIDSLTFTLKSSDASHGPQGARSL